MCFEDPTKIYFTFAFILNSILRAKSEQVQRSGERQKRFLEPLKRHTDNIVGSLGQ
jgi:hypothetical protein